MRVKTILAGALLACAPAVFGADDAVKRVTEAGKVFDEIMNTPDKSIPKEILDNAACIGIVPGLKKAGFIVGGQYGKGVLSCRTANGWSGPSTIRVEGGSFGFQLGAGETDLVFAVMNQRGAEKLMKSEFQIGGEADAMAGPVGRSASAATDAYMRAEILSWSRSRGAFAGIALKGSTLRSDDSDNRAIYGRAVTHEDILHGKARPPASVMAFVREMRRWASGAKVSDADRSMDKKRSTRSR